MSEKLKLTPFGEFVRQHTAMNAPTFWTQLWKRANQVADQDGEWEMLLKEVESGAREMRERFYEFQAQQ